MTAFDNEQRIERLGYEVVGTRDNFADAERDLDQGEVDLLLADIQLTGERSGIDLARHASERGVPVLFVTGNPPGECAAFALGSLIKPFNDKQLKEAIEAVECILAGKAPRPPKGMTLYEKA